MYLFCDIFDRLDSQMDLLNRNFALVGKRCCYLTRNNVVLHVIVFTYHLYPFTDSYEHAMSFISPTTNILPCSPPPPGPLQVTLERGRSRLRDRSSKRVTIPS